MKTEEALEQISYMKGLLNATRLRTAEGYPFFILWGCIWVLGYLGSICFGYYTWGVFGCIGGIASGIIGTKWPWSSRSNNKLLSQLGIQALLFFVVSGIIFGLLMWSGLTWINNIYWPITIGVIYLNIGVFMGKDLMLIGLSLILTAMLSLLLPGFYQLVWLAVVGGGGLITTGMIFRKQVKKRG